jgi:dsRNA-specific ribonuclease
MNTENPFDFHTALQSKYCQKYSLSPPKYIISTFKNDQNQTLYKCKTLFEGKEYEGDDKTSLPEAKNACAEKIYNHLVNDKAQEALFLKEKQIHSKDASDRVTPVPCYPFRSDLIKKETSRKKESKEKVEPQTDFIPLSPIEESIQTTQKDKTENVREPDIQQVTQALQESSLVSEKKSLSNLNPLFTQLLVPSFSKTQDPVSILYEFCQRTGTTQGVYFEEKTLYSPGGIPAFQTQCSIGNQIFPLSDIQRSKKLAKKDAARKAIDVLIQNEKLTLT